MDVDIGHRLATGGLLLAFLVLDSESELLAQREGGAFWGPFAHGGSHGASTAPSGCAPGYITRDPRCDRPARQATKPQHKSSGNQLARP
jgi:hypothetical protein